MKILDEIIEVHGGMDYWDTLEAVEADISAAGFLFMAKRRPVLDHIRMRASAREPRFTFFDFPGPGKTAELIGIDEVRILDPDGKVIARREDPRMAFRGARHLFSWDDLDFIYFAGYATWNYLTAPFLLMRKDVIVRELSPLSGDLARLTRLHVTFPDDIPTHSREQVYYFDDQRLLRRLDYTAEVVGNWAHAAHLCDGYQLFGKLKVPTRRRVFPLPFGHRHLPGPTLVAIDVHDVRPTVLPD